jgi:hypothetical protein
MNAADYADWCKYAGIYLGRHSHADRYSVYQKKLSQTGLYVRVVYDFLQDTQGGINVQDWRSSAVYEIGPAAAGRVALTADALAAVGAEKLSARVRVSRDTSPMGMLYERPGDMNAIAEFMANRDPVQLMEQLRSNLARVQQKLSGEPPTPPQTTDTDVEPWAEVERLLANYVKAHEDDLQGDVKKYGDVRKEPGFDAEEREAELERMYRLELDREQQKEQAAKMRELMAELEKKLGGKKAPKPGKYASQRLKFLECYKQHSRRPPEELIPAMAEWLRDAEQFQEKHPTFFRPRPVEDEALLKLLDQWGQHDVDVRSDGVTVRWDDPLGLTCDWTTFALSVEFPLGDAEALRRVLDECARVRLEFAKHQAEMRRQVLEHYDMYRDWFEAKSLEYSEVDESGRPTEAAILEHAGGGHIIVHMRPWGEDSQVTVEVFFGVGWYEEHGLELSL